MTGASGTDATTACLSHAFHNIIVP